RMDLKKLGMSKRGQLAGLSGNVISIVVAIIILVLGLVIVQELRDTQTAGTEAFTAANSSLVGLGQFADFIPLIVLAVAAAVIIGLILAGFAFRGQR
ncbi:MAG: hypothetical protein WD512_04235, partial [Candidatus Paceibacterota bacterium]